MSVSGVFHYAKNRKLTNRTQKTYGFDPEDFKLEGKFDKQVRTYRTYG